MRQVRRSTAGRSRSPKPDGDVGAVPRPGCLASDPVRGDKRSGGGAGRDLQRQAWLWAQANRAGDGSLPSGREIGRRYDRHERWGRLVERAGVAGQFAAEPSLRLVEQQPSLDKRH